VKLFFAKRDRNVPQEDTFTKKKKKIWKHRKSTSKKYRSVSFASPEDSDIQIIYKDANQNIKNVIKSLFGSSFTSNNKNPKPMDVRRTAVIEDHASFVLLTYRGKRHFPSTVDCVTPLFYALPLYYSEGGTEIFIMKYNKEIGIAVMFDSEMIGYSSFHYSGSISSDEFGDMLEEQIHLLLSDLNSLGAYIQPDRIIYLHRPDDEVPSVITIEKLNISQPVHYNIKNIKYTDVLNLKNPYKNKFLSDFSITSFASFIAYGESNLSPKEKVVYKTLFSALNFLAVIVILAIVANVGNGMLSYKNSLMQKDLSSIEAKKKYVMEYQQKYKSMLSLAQNYMKIKNIDNNNVLPAVSSILSQKNHIQVYKFNMSNNKVVIYVSSTDANYVAQYIQDLMNTHFFASVSLPRVYGTGQNGKKNYIINAILSPTFYQTNNNNAMSIGG
jgi:hypothetical protein